MSAKIADKHAFDARYEECAHNIDVDSERERENEKENFLERHYSSFRGKIA